MEFLSLPFVILFLFTFLLYYSVKRRETQRMILLFASIIFIGYYKLSYVFVALFISIFTYFAGKYLYRQKNTKRVQAILISSIVILVAVWLIFRYCTSSFPLGMSFYTFQAISYIVNIYWEDEEPEEDVMDFVLYMLLFMKFLSGPIERGYDLLPQLKKKHLFAYENVVYGMKLLMLGLMMKYLVADKIDPYLDNIFNSIYNSTNIQRIEAALLYPIQLYADFAGYTNMAIGIGIMFGFKLSPNFNRPFISSTTSELWRRWHITLSSWVRDYVFVPLTAANRVMGKSGVYLSLLVTFIVLGAWHGAGLTFIVYGLIQGLIIMYEVAAQKQRRAVKQFMGNGLYTSFSIIRTYLLFAFSLLFFRIDTFNHVWFMLSHLFSFSSNNISYVMSLGMPDHCWIQFGIACILMFVYEYYNDKNDLLVKLSRCPLAVRWTVYYVCLIIFITCGTFDNDSFIYIQF